MRITRLFRNIRSGLPYLGTEIRSLVSDRTPFFVAKPRTMYIWWSDRCNARCIMCPIGIQGPKKRVGPEGQELPYEMLEQRLREAHELAGKGLLVSFISGEPLLYRHLFSLIETAKSLDVDLSFTTNGYLLDRECARRLSELDPFNIGVSLESLDATINETLRPYKNGTRLTTDALAFLQAERKAHNASFSINIKCTLTQLNFRSLPGIIERYGKEEGVFITPQPFEGMDGVPRETVERLTIRDTREFKNTMREVMELKRQGYSVNADEQNLHDFIHKFVMPECPGEETTGPRVAHPRCVIGNTTLFISSNGDVKLCPSMPAIGSLKDRQSLKDMWYGDAARDVRRRIAGCRQICSLACTRSTSLWGRARIFLRR